MKMLSLAAALAAVTLSALPAHAQVDITTSVGNGWQVRCTAINGATPTALCNGSTFHTAVAVTPGANDWPPGPWIGPIANGSLGQQNGENPRWAMTFRKYVSFTGVQATDIALITVDRLLLDNYFVGASLNGIAFTPNWSGPAGAPLPPNGSNWRKEFAFTNSLTGALVEGSNVLEFTITGNGRTDMLSVQGTIGRLQASTVPEPATLGLLLVGMVTIGARARRRAA